jgi:hypothetical protein
LIAQSAMAMAMAVHRSGYSHADGFHGQASETPPMIGAVEDTNSHDPESGPRFLSTARNAKFHRGNGLSQSFAPAAGNNRS